MASIQLEGKIWHCQFYWKNQRYTYAIAKVTRFQAEAKAARTDELIVLLKRGLA